MKVSAKCMNHSGCLKAYRGEIIELDPTAPLVCPECGKPLTKAGGGAGGAVKMLAIAVGVLVIAVGAVVGMKLMKKSGAETTEAEPTPAAETTPAPSATPEPPEKKTVVVPPPPPPPPKATPVAPPPPPPADEPVAAPIAMNEPVTDVVRTEVLARIDKIPNLSPEKKDRLYVSVQRARDMRKIVEIGFGSGQSTMPASSGPQVKKLLEDPAVMKFRDDLTAVFVVLGFADTTGNPQANYEISDKRAKSVVEFMEKQAGVKNVTHAVAMGGTTLVDKNNAAKNRIAEIWAVLP